ncbi:MAG: tetratricopeptide repeat protein, partial [Anaerolineales bacterium]
SPHPQVALERWSLSLLIFLGSIFLLDSLENGWSENNWENSLILICLVFSFLEITLAAYWYFQASALSGQSIFSLPFGYRSSGLFMGHANVLSGYLNLIIPILTIRIFSQRQTRTRLAFIVLLSPLAITQFLTSSRGGWLSGAGGLAIALGYYFVKHTSIRKQLSEMISPRRLKFRTTMIAIFSLLGITLGGWLFLRQTQITPGHAPIQYSRSGIWEPALNIFRESPIVGHGLASFSTLFSAQNLTPPGFTTSHAHNLFLQILTQSGVIGLILVVAMASLLAKDLILSAWVLPKKHVPQFSIYLGGIAAFFLHHFVDYLLESPAYVIALAIIFTLAIHRTRSTFINIPLRQSQLLIGSSFLIVILLNVIPLKANIAYWRGVEAFRGNRLDEAADLICIAAQDDPLSFYQFQCGLSQAFLANVRQDDFHIVLARDAYQQGLLADSGWPVDSANYSALLYESGNTEEAIRLLKATLERAPRQFSLWMNLALWLDNLGMAAETHEVILQALESYPLLYRSEIFSRDQAWAASLDDFIATHVMDLDQDLSFTAWQALDASNYDKAEMQFRTIIASNPLSASGYKGLSETQFFKSNYDNAKANIRIALFLDPSDPYAHFLLGRIHEANNDVEDALRSYSNGYTALSKLSDSWSYYARTYHRFFPEPDFVPQLIRYFPTRNEVSILCTLASHHYESIQPETVTEIRNYLLRLGAEASCIEW